MRKFEEFYVAIWCLMMPVTSLLIVPAVQGTIVPYMMAFGSLAFILMSIRSGQISQAVVGYFKSFAIVILLWVALLCGSQFADLMNPQVNFQDMFLISDDNARLLRPSLFTQSLYFLACIMIALYFRYFFRESWTKYLYLGAWTLSVYGLYDWLFYLIFHQSGDFIANRTFSGGDHPGSWSQTINFGGLEILRLKSTLGEPSFVSAVVIPYLFMAIDGQKKFLALLLVVCAILTTSTAVYIGLLVSFFLQALWSSKSRNASIVVLGMVALALIAMSLFFPDIFGSLFGDKFSGDNESGKDRLKNIAEYEILFHQFGILNWIFGVGFGYLYFSLMWSLTANTGLLGIGSLLFTLLKPAYLLPRVTGSEWIKISMIAIVVVIILTLSELFVPTTWMFIGLAYRKLDQLELERRARLAARNRAPDPTPALSLADSRG